VYTFQKCSRTSLLHLRKDALPEERLTFLLLHCQNGFNASLVGWLTFYTEVTNVFHLKCKSFVFSRIKKKVMKPESNSKTYQ
jgi:hypothetical protein